MNAEKLKQLLVSLLPGLFLIGFNIGTGSVTAMAKAGSKYGMSLLWTVGISCYITYFLIDIFGQFTIVTGETALEAFRKHIHPSVGIFFIVALTAHVCGSVMGVMGIIADICNELSLSLLEGGIGSSWFAAFFVLLVYVLFLHGEFDFFQRVLAVIVAVMAICFLFNFLYLMPSPGEILAGLIPRIPEEAGTGSEQTPLLVVASMVGTTVFSGLFIIRTSLVKEADWSFKEWKVQRRDAMVSAAMMFVISISIMASAAGTLHLSGIDLQEARQMITLLEPLAGPFATIIFGIGIVAAGVSSQFPNIMLFPILLRDYQGKELNIKNTWIRVVVLGISLLGLVVPLFDAPPVLVMIISQAFGALLLPFTISCILYLGNRKDLMKKHAFSAVTNTIMSAVLLFSLFMAWNGLRGILSF